MNCPAEGLRYHMHAGANGASSPEAGGGDHDFTKKGI